MRALILVCQLEMKPGEVFDATGDFQTRNIMYTNLVVIRSLQTVVLHTVCTGLYFAAFDPT